MKWSDTNQRYFNKRTHWVKHTTSSKCFFSTSYCTDTHTTLDIQCIIYSECIKGRPLYIPSEMKHEMGLFFIKPQIIHHNEKDDGNGRMWCSTIQRRHMLTLNVLQLVDENSLMTKMGEEEEQYNNKQIIIIKTTTIKLIIILIVLIYYSHKYLNPLCCCAFELIITARSLTHIDLGIFFMFQDKALLQSRFQSMSEQVFLQDVLVFDPLILTSLPIPAAESTQHDAAAFTSGKSPLWEYDPLKNMVWMNIVSLYVLFFCVSGEKSINTTVH